MIFSIFKRTQVGNTILFANEIPIESVGKILYGQDNSSSAGWVKKEFRWSFNKTHWSSWTPLNQENLVSISTGTNKFLFLEVRYVSAGAGTCTSFTLNYTPATGPVYAPPVEGVSMDHDHILPDGCNDLGGVVQTFDVTHVTDSDMLCGKGCDFYLWRPNHKGEQPISSITDLSKILANLGGAIQNVVINEALNVEGPGIGVYYGLTDKKIYFKTLVEGNKMFITEDPEGHITLSVDDASFGQLFTLLGSFNGVNVGGGAGDIFKQRVGNDLQFRTLAAGNANIIITTVGDQVRISLDSSISGEAIWADTDPVSATVGGIHSGDTLDGSTSLMILEKMLYEYFPPNITLLTSPLPTGYYEKYQPIPDISIYGTFNNFDFAKLRITDVSLYSSLAGGIGTLNYPDACVGSFSFNDSYVSPNWENIIYTVQIFNKVNTIIMPPAETSTSINFVNPYTWGLVDNTINAGNITETVIKGFINDGNKLIIPKQSNLINFIRDASMGMKVKFVYAYDASYGPLNSIFDIQNNFNVTTSFDSTIIDLNGLGASSNPVPYQVYIKSHWIDVSTFKLIFNI